MPRDHKRRLGSWRYLDFTEKDVEAAVKAIQDFLKKKILCCNDVIMAPSCVLEYLLTLLFLHVFVFKNLEVVQVTTICGYFRNIRKPYSWSKLPQAVVTWTTKVFLKIWELWLILRLQTYWVTKY